MIEVVPFEGYFIPAIIAILGLKFGAEWFVDGASSLSLSMGVRPLLIGIVVMGFGTSVPELLISVISSATGNPMLSMGNAYGSNIVNIGLVLGLCAIISPIIVQNHVLRRELPLLILATAVTAYIIMDYEVSRFDAIVLLVVFAAVLAFLFWAYSRESNHTETTKLEGTLQDGSVSLQSSIRQLVAGLILIAICAAVMVWSAKGIVTDLRVSELVVGVVILALGSSLPELAVIIAATRKGEHELALGNVIGSNLFNTLAVVGLASVITPFAVDSELVNRALPVMFAFTGTIAFMAYGWGRRSGVINKLEGLFLLLAFAAYMAYLVYTNPIMS